MRAWCFHRRWSAFRRLWLPRFLRDTSFDNRRRRRRSRADAVGALTSRSARPERAPTGETAAVRVPIVAIVVVGPGQADHVRGHPEIDTLFFGASHVGAACGAGGHLVVACRAFGRRTLLLSWNNRNPHTGETAHLGRRPAKQFPVLLSVWVVGAVEIQPLVLTRTRRRGNELRCGARQDRPERRPIRAEVLVDVPHGERVVPEVYPQMDPLRQVSNPDRNARACPYRYPAVPGGISCRVSQGPFGFAAILATTR